MRFDCAGLRVIHGLAEWVEPVTRSVHVHGRRPFVASRLAESRGQVEIAFGRARFHHQYRHKQRGPWRLLRGLEYQQAVPLASTGPILHDAMSSGKFHGTMAPTTPMGSRVMVRESARGLVGAASS